MSTADTCNDCEPKTEACPTLLCAQRCYVVLVPFVQRMVSEKRFLNESDDLAEGLRLLQAREMLHEEVKKRFDQLDAGKGIAAEVVYQSAEERIREIENGKG